MNKQTVKDIAIQNKRVLIFVVLFASLIFYFTITIILKPIIRLLKKISSLKRAVG